ncbi:FGGY-family carbohydrate kinase [Ruminococcus sp. HUN007]|uniref:xylulokinase n=1 Tax=Ruminococcus sp. HUN007 TaxID=1514668 RepID=UPI0005D26DED|nr:FGGY-family carbohydrate kinase [Ruminococcus sp. HUN007]
MSTNENKFRNCLGIEFGSTRIKAVVTDNRFEPVSSGDYTWKSSYTGKIWTYDLDEVWKGLNEALKKADTSNVDAAGISGMMHGYLAFDSDWNLLVPFRTWQNTITGKAAEELTELFDFNIPQRWSIAHLYQAVLNGEEHISKLAHITTLAGYVHYMLTGVNAVGIGEASGIFPVDSETSDYDSRMLDKFDKLMADMNCPVKIREVLPKVLTAGETAGKLTEAGAALIGNALEAGIPFAPPEGDAGTGMTATNAVAPGTGNVSAGTSVFSMIVLDKPLSRVYPEIDMVTTPTGKPVAMVHCNNCTNDMNAWVNIFKEAVSLYTGKEVSDDIFTKLYEKSLEGDADCGGVIVNNYLAGESITHFDEGCPMVLRNAESSFNLANLTRSMLYSTIATLKIGMDILADENVKIRSLTGHGGLFKTPVVGQKYLAAACGAPVTVMKTAGEGGPYGMALLAAYMLCRKDSGTLEEFLNEKVFVNTEISVLSPEKTDTEGFENYMEKYKKSLDVERTAVISM